MEEPQQLIKHFCWQPQTHGTFSKAFASSRHLATARVCVGGSSGELRQGGPPARDMSLEMTLRIYSKRRNTRKKIY